MTRNRNRLHGIAALIWLVVCGPIQAVGQSSLVDPSFSIGAGTDGPVNSIVVDGQGTIWVGGEFSVISGQSNAYIARLLADGAVDPSVSVSTDGPVYGLAVQEDGKVLVAGSFTNVQGEVRRGIARFQTNGILDNSFDAGVALGADKGVFAIHLQPDGKILASTTYDYTVGCRVFRLLSNGEPDPDFVNTNIFSSYVFTFALTGQVSLDVGQGSVNRSRSALVACES